MLAFGLRRLVCVLAIAVFPAAAFAQRSPEPAQLGKVPYKSPFLAGGMSLVMPGSGQVYTGHWKRGVIWFVAAAASWYSVILTDEDYAWNGMYVVYAANSLDAATDALAYNRDARLRAGLALMPRRAQIRMFELTF